MYLKQLNVDCKKIDNKEFKGRKYIVSFEALKESYINNNWLLDSEKEDIEEINDDKEDKPKLKNSPLDNGIYLEPDYKKLYFELLEKQKETPKQVQKTDEITEDDIETLEKEQNDVCNNIKPKQQEEKPEPEPEPENNFDDNDIIIVWKIYRGIRSHYIYIFILENNLYGITIFSL